ncbi:MAG: type I CRISPR-associated protein Cas7 [Candidatus Thermoplasmatota archaeon]|nr:type I CRISPR-associated protein Cas7 [Candidatus Thermoplasmatota archaeon]
MSDNEKIVRATGLLVIEVRNSNPNGDPDRESDPRTRNHDRRGIVTGVSFKRKLRDLVDKKDGDVWKNLSEKLNLAEESGGYQYEILETRGRKREEIIKLKREEFQKRYWDARVFGNTFLESFKDDKESKKEDKEHFIRTGVVQFALGLSVAPIRIERITNTNKAGVEGDKDRGMAPLGYRIVEHAVYCMPFSVNQTASLEKHGTGCRKKDIDLLLKLIPYAYPHTRSHIRPFVEVRHAWYAEHLDALGSFSEFAFIEAMTPKRKGNSENPSVANISLEDQYEVPKEKDIPDNLKKKVKSFSDLCDTTG